jgi:hypothetical protein
VVDTEIKEEKEKKEQNKAREAGRGGRSLAGGGGVVVDGDQKRKKAVLGCLSRLLSSGKEDELGQNSEKVSFFKNSEKGLFFQNFPLQKSCVESTVSGKKDKMGRLFC